MVICYAARTSRAKKEILLKLHDCAGPGVVRFPMQNFSVAEVLKNIYHRVKYASDSAAEAYSEGLWADDLAELRRLHDELFSLSSSVGSMPPQPNTLRGRVGARLIRIVQRMLFWYTPQILRCNLSVTAVLKQVCALQESQFQSAILVHKQLNNFEKELGFLKLDIEQRASQQAEPCSGGQHPNSSARQAGNRPERDPRSWERFLFSLTDHFRGSEEDVTGKLRKYLDIIDSSDPPPPEAGWLDIGCGRGEWLRLSQERGQRTLGIDSSTYAISYCKRQGFNVEHHDAIDYLNGLPDQVLGVVTAFHVLEHCSTEYNLSLMREVARALKPGGLLIVEAPNPGNLLLASEDFWLDPTHHRLTPAGLVEFLFQYCGLRVVQRLDLNPHPEDKHLPFTQDFHFGPGTVTVYTRAAPNTTSFRAEPCTSPPAAGPKARPSAHRR